jgi:Trk-type K+ transport system membrane component
MKHTARLALAFASLCCFTSAACGLATSAVARQQPASSARHQVSNTITLGPSVGVTELPTPETQRSLKFTIPFRVMGTSSMDRIMSHTGTPSRPGGPQFDPPPFG